MSAQAGGMQTPHEHSAIEKPTRGSVNWAELRVQSLQPGGFGSERVNIWPKLLHVSYDNVTAQSSNTEPPSSEPHRDERQIRLDTDRSFVLYPVGLSHIKDVLQEKLHDLLVSIFRKHPTLNYFQGYHDIITILFLTLPPELQLICAEKLSLQRVRDSMGTGLEPLLGLLRVSRNLLRLADHEFAKTLEKSSPFPFFALSNLLTLFSHDMPTLPLIQHVFDYILCRPPIIIVYLATAIILSRKDEVKRLEEEGEEGMIHALLSSLPVITDEVPEDMQLDASLDTANNGLDGGITKEYDLESNALKDSEDTSMSEDKISNPGCEPDPVVLESLPTNEKLAEPEMTLDFKPSSMEQVSDVPEGTKKTPAETAEQHTTQLDDLPRPESTPPTPSNNPAKPKEPPDHHPHSTQITLATLLTHADLLYAQYPPTHPLLSLSSIMGPQSVIYTWSESISELPSDNLAEAMVNHPELIVYPHIEEPPDNDQKNDTRLEKRKHRKLRKLRTIERRTLLAGVVLVLGVAMAVYGTKGRNGATPFSIFFDGKVHSQVRDWKRVGAWVGGVLFGASAKFLNGLAAH